MNEMKKRLRAIWLRLHRKHICEHKNCLKLGMQCRLPDYDYEGDYHYKGDLIFWYCSEHCQLEGFCWGCGEFWGGCEAFDFNIAGLCPNCKGDLDAEDEMADIYNDELEEGFVC